MVKVFADKLGVKALTTNPVQKQFPKSFSMEVMDRVKKFHGSVKGYAPTPLVELDGLADLLGVKKIFIKDESFRFGLNAFKGLGATYAVSKILCKRLDLYIDEIGFDYFKSNEIKEQLKGTVFTTASDGNHGKALAWVAAQCGCRAVIYLNKGTAQRRVDAVREVGGEACVTDLNYDDTVRLASQKAEENGWFLVQDTAFEGYCDIPRWISQGYATMGVEAAEQLNQLGIDRPSHVFLQAGVGAMAGGVLGYYANRFKSNLPYTIILEPTRAACYFESALADDGKARFVKGSLESIMAGLACGEPNMIAWEIIRDFANAYVSCQDYMAAKGMRLLAAPVNNDARVVSGESGAIGIGLLSVLMENKDFKEQRDAFGLNKDSIVLAFSTEGDTDPEHYKQIVDGNKYPSSS